MMKNQRRNFAFIDAQNLTMGIVAMGWKLDWKKFFVYLKDKYKIDKVFVFIGFIETNTEFYNLLRRCGYILVFKPVVIDIHRNIKGNCDGDMIVYIMSRLRNYDKAIVVTSDGDFYSTVRFLRHGHKLGCVLSPNVHKCAKLLKFEAGGLIEYLNHLQHKLSMR